jgi:hypothetical protein
LEDFARACELAAGCVAGAAATRVAGATAAVRDGDGAGACVAAATGAAAAGFGGAAITSGGGTGPGSGPRTGSTSGASARRAVGARCNITPHQNATTTPMAAHANTMNGSRRGSSVAGVAAIAAASLPFSNQAAVGSNRAMRAK